MDKDKLRKIYREQRMALTQEQCRRNDELILSHLKQMDWSAYTYVHVFLSISRFNEPDLSNFVLWMKSAHAHVKFVISRSQLQEGTMTHFVWDDETVFVENKWGIAEPVDGLQVDEQTLDLIFVPLLVADRWGHRIGYGKGFYDRFLMKCRVDVTTIGVSYFPILSEKIKADSWDIALKAIVTPEEMYSVESYD